MFNFDLFLVFLTNHIGWWWIAREKKYYVDSPFGINTRFGLVYGLKRKYIKRTYCKCTIRYDWNNHFRLLRLTFEKLFKKYNTLYIYRYSTTRSFYINRLTLHLPVLSAALFTYYLNSKIHYGTIIKINSDEKKSNELM